MDRIDLLVGKTLSKIERKYISDDAKDKLYFTTIVGETYLMEHQQDCCEQVYLDEIIGDLDDLLHSQIMYAEEVSNQVDGRKNESDESYTWTFYKISTIKGSVTLRWYGSSNGYYSERVNFKLIDG